jgi:hypothetical protein
MTIGEEGGLGSDINALQCLYVHAQHSAIAVVLGGGWKVFPCGGSSPSRVSSSESSSDEE